MNNLTISPNKISSNFYNQLELLLKTKKVIFFQMRLKKYSYKQTSVRLLVEGLPDFSLGNRENEIGKSYFKNNSQKVIDISITPNRADCLGVRGIARDLSSAGVGKLIQIKKKKLKQKAKHLIKTFITMMLIIESMTAIKTSKMQKFLPDRFLDEDCFTHSVS